MPPHMSAARIRRNEESTAMRRVQHADRSQRGAATPRHRARHTERSGAQWSPAVPPPRRRCSEEAAAWGDRDDRQAGRRAGTQAQNRVTHKSPNYVIKIAHLKTLFQHGRTHESTLITPCGTGHGTVHAERCRPAVDRMAPHCLRGPGQPPGGPRAAPHCCTLRFIAAASRVTRHCAALPWRGPGGRPPDGLRAAPH